MAMGTSGIGFSRCILLIKIGRLVVSTSSFLRSDDDLYILLQSKSANQKYLLAQYLQGSIVVSDFRKVVRVKIQNLSKPSS